MESQGFFGYDEHMRVLLFRHAEKQVIGTANPKLSPVGLQQAEKILSEVSAKKIPTPQVLLVSPRIRTQQTFEPLSLSVNIKLSVSPFLNERTSEESVADFRLRIQEFLVLLQMDYTNNECIYLCTHYDWIETFLSVIECSTDLLQTKYSHWGTAQWMLLDKTDQWHLIKFDRISV